jgi:hypothetical protein
VEAAFDATARRVDDLRLEYEDRPNHRVLVEALAAVKHVNAALRKTYEDFYKGFVAAVMAERGLNCADAIALIEAGQVH